VTDYSSFGSRQKISIHFVGGSFEARATRSHASVIVSAAIGVGVSEAGGSYGHGTRLIELFLRFLVRLVFAYGLSFPGIMVGCPRFSRLNFIRVGFVRLGFIRLGSIRLGSIRLHQFS